MPPAAASQTFSLQQHHTWVMLLGTPTMLWADRVILWYCQPDECHSHSRWRSVIRRPSAPAGGAVAPCSAPPTSLGRFSSRARRCPDHAGLHRPSPLHYLLSNYLQLIIRLLLDTAAGISQRQRDHCLETVPSCRPSTFCSVGVCIGGRTGCIAA